MEDISPATLRSRVGSTFGIADGSGRVVPFVLTSVEDGLGTLVAVLTAAEDHALHQGVYEVSHDGLTPTALLAVPDSPRTLCVTFTWLAPPDAVH